MTNLIEILADRAEDAVEAYGLMTDADSAEAALRDLLGDLRHYADARGLNFHDINKDANATYLQELKGN